MDYFWKKRNLFYTILSIYVVLGHTGGSAYYNNAGIVVPRGIQYVVDVLSDPTWMLSSVKGFFFFSGLILFRREKGENISVGSVFQKSKKRLIRLLIPYFTWNIIYCLFYICLNIVPFAQDGAGGGHQHFVWSFTSIFNGIFLYEYNAHFWYMLQLIIFVFLSVLIYYAIYYEWVGVVICAILYYVFYKGISFYPFLLYEQDAFFFFVLGCFAGRYLWCFFKSPCPKMVSYAMLVVWVIIMLTIRIAIVNSEFTLCYRTIFLFQYGMQLIC